MSYVQHLLNRLFPDDEQALAVATEEKGLIKRSLSFTKAREKWSEVTFPLLEQSMRRNIMLASLGTQPDRHVVWLNLKHAKGFQLRTEDHGIGVENGPYLLDHIKTLTESMGYQIFNREFERRVEGNDLVEKQWYYLKRPLSTFLGEPPYEQGFGNIHIEWNRTPNSSIKVLVTSYTDRNYQDPWPIMDYIKGLFPSDSQ